MSGNDLVDVWAARKGQSGYTASIDSGTPTTGTDATYGKYVTLNDRYYQLAATCELMEISRSGTTQLHMNKVSSGRRRRPPGPAARARPRAGGARRAPRRRRGDVAPAARPGPQGRPGHARGPGPRGEVRGAPWTLLPHQYAVDATTACWARFYHNSPPTRTRSLRENTDYTGTCGRIFFFVSKL